MARTEEELHALLLAQLTPAEREHGVAYTLATPIPQGATLEFPSCTLQVPWPALLIFIDGDPRANWGHPCRYVLINRNTGETRLVEARFPPMSRASSKYWRIAYRAPGVPDAALLAPL